jgi:hypothetical protein
MENDILLEYTHICFPIDVIEHCSILNFSIGSKFKILYDDGRVMIGYLLTESVITLRNA